MFVGFVGASRRTMSVMRGRTRLPFCHVFDNVVRGVHISEFPGKTALHPRRRHFHSAMLFLEIPTTLSVVHLLHTDSAGKNQRPRSQLHPRRGGRRLTILRRTDYGRVVEGEANDSEENFLCSHKQSHVKSCVAFFLDIF
jgi:hypothetical protein